ncbi:MAG TPA: RDD family protein [Thermoanaerobaculia bacterium]|nr:RDD family protein [Thermoanaerobaculia bacterium]
MRFDEVELLTFEDAAPPSLPPPIRSPFLRRAAALLIDVSLFAALALALSPLLPAAMSWIAVAGLAGFVVLVSYYYFVGSWMLWGKTIGGAIFDVRVARAMSLRNASVRWLVLCAVMIGAAGGVFVYLKA